MTLASRATARLAKMPPAKTHDVSVERSISIPMPDGVTLIADRYYPTAQPSGLPLLITRTPYGRSIEGALARILAERGYQVLIVSCRSTFGSGGVWVPFRNERADGQAVLTWTEKQPWFAGKVGLFGASYVGMTQWSVIDGLPDYVTAWAPTVTSSYFADLFYPGDGFALETVLTWIESVAHQEEPIVKRLLGVVAAKKAIAKASMVLPLSDADVAVTGALQPQYQDWLDYAGPDETWWAPVKFDTDISKTPPGNFTAGWYDIFLPNQVRDYVALRAAGREARIAIGPWTHGSLGQAGQAMRGTLEWMDRYVAGSAAAPKDEPRVKLLVMGADKWVEFPDWPPPATSQRWHLHSGGGLSVDAPAESAPDTFRYDPADPTPGIGGGSLLAQNAGRKDNKVRESRNDVLLYTSDAMTDDLTVAGPVSADLHVRSSLDYTDFFVRLCDVDAKGRSFNLADGIVRIGPDHPRPKDGGLELHIELFPTANTFAKGHRIRLQVSSGAHPLYVRNLGTGEPLSKATTMVAADQEVFHDPSRPSSLVLPVLATPVRA
jgi:hypothetical protein